MNIATDNIREDIYFSRLVSHQNTLAYMLGKVRGIFNYEGLPLTIPRDVLEGYLTQSGSAVFYEHEGDFFVSDATPYGEADIYGRQVEVSIAHKIDGIQKQLTRRIGVDAVLICNDPERAGLSPLLEEYAALMAQAKLSMLRAFVDLRSTRIIQAKDQNSYEAALAYEDSLRRGDITVMLAEELGDMTGVEVHQTPVQGNPATQIIELTQYVQSLYYGELGLDVNNNLKRAYVSESELEKTTGAPLLDIMHDCRQEAVRDINALFGTDITVSIAETWAGDMNTADNTNAEEADNAQPESDGTAGGSGGSGGSGEPAADEEPDEEGTEEADGDPEEPEEATSEEVTEAAAAMLGEETETAEEADNG